MKKFIGTGIVLLFTMFLSAQTTVDGYVYEDSNNNGKKERRENGIPHVAVSNGQEVVLTNKYFILRNILSYFWHKAIVFRKNELDF